MSARKRCRSLPGRSQKYCSGGVKMISLKENPKKRYPLVGKGVKGPRQAVVNKCAHI